MSKKNRIFLSVISSFMLGVITIGLWARLGPLGPSVNQALANNSGAQYQEEDEGPMADQPDKALAWRNLSLMDENGLIPADGLIIADQQIDEMRARQEASGRAITSNAWTWLGPGNIGGRVRSIIIHPTNTNIMWAGSVTGGIWKTTNGGASWAVLDDFMTNMSVSTMVIDPTDPLILYAGTGEGVMGASDIAQPYGEGVFKSIDGGTTWNQLSSTYDDNWYFVNRLAISPANHLILLAATQSGMWKSIDGGTSWVKAATVNKGIDVNFNPNDGTKAVAGEYGGRAWYSTNSGDSWNAATFTSISGGADRVDLAYARSDPSIVYASVNVNGGEIWKSVNGGQTYTRFNTGDSFLGTQGNYDNIIWVDPTDPNKLIVGGIDLWRSTDGGATLTKISEWQDPISSAHADQHMIVEHPGFNGTSNKTVFFGNDGGVYRADDVSTVIGTTGWTELNNNLGITQFYGAAGNPTTGKIVGGTQDNGTLFYTPAGGTEGWTGNTGVLGGDGGWSAADPTDPNYFYGEYVNGRVFRSTDGGLSAEYIWGGIFGPATKVDPYVITDAGLDKANFIAPVILDPNNANRLLVGGESLWRTNDVKTPNTPTEGPSWSAIKTPTTGNSNISAIVIAPGNSDIIWVGHNNGDVYVTTNGTSATPTWVKVDGNAPGLPDRYVTRITIDKNNTSKAYVTFGGFSADNVWVTTNGGSSWSDVTGTGVTGLPNLPVRSLVINPLNSNYLYIGTELGIFTSEDGGATWDVSHNGPTNTPVDELFWMNTKLVAATFGRGLFSQEANLTAATSLVNSVLPTSRTVPSGNLATIFNTVINAGANPAYGITLSMNPAPAGTFTYQQTNCNTNAIIGGINPSLDLAPGGVLCYVLSFTPSATFSATSVHIRAQAANTPSTNLLTGINTWLLRSTASVSPDIIALTTTTDFHQVACSGANAFAVALSNVGAAATGDITVTANTGSASLPISVFIQETNPGTGAIIGDNILNNLGAGENRTVAVFVTFNSCINFDPAANRIFIEFRDASNNVVGSTSTAVSTNR